MAYRDILHPPRPSPWSFVDRGADSIVSSNQVSRMVRKHYPQHSFDEVDAYRSASVACADFLYANPIERNIDGERFVLRDITPVVGLEYDKTKDSWSAFSPLVPGPHLSAIAYDPSLFNLLIQGLDPSEQAALFDLHLRFCDPSQPQMQMGIDRMLQEAKARLVRATGNLGIDLIYLNTKVRHYPEENFTRLIITDISPSVRRIAYKTSFYA